MFLHVSLSQQIRPWIIFQRPDTPPWPRLLPTVSLCSSYSSRSLQIMRFCPDFVLFVFGKRRCPCLRPNKPLVFQTVAKANTEIKTEQFEGGLTTMGTLRIRDCDDPCNGIDNRASKKGEKRLRTAEEKLLKLQRTTFKDVFVSKKGNTTLIQRLRVSSEKNKHFEKCKSRRKSSWVWKGSEGGGFEWRRIF